MKDRIKIKIAADILMLILMPLLMLYQIIGEALHEYLGILLTLVFILHALMNCIRYLGSTKGSYSVFRTVQTVIYLFLPLIIISMALSGIVISRHVFVDTGIESGQGSARIVHMLGAYWGFIIMSIHAGMHGKFLTGMIKKRRKRGKKSRIAKITGNTAAAVIALYGAFVFIRSEIPLYMFLRTQFVYFDQAKPFLHYFTDYLSMMWLWIFTGYYASEKMTRLRSIKHV